MQTLEDRAHRIYGSYNALPESMASDASLAGTRDGLLAAALAFRDAINSDRKFVVYKTLVGFESVFPPAWDDPSFGYREAEEYRSAQVELMLNEVTDATAEAWFELLSRCAQTQSSDAATFPTFGRFLSGFGETKPDIVIAYLEKMDPQLTRFLPSMLAGLGKSVHAEAALKRIDGWLAEARYLSDIAWYMRFAQPFDESLLRRVLDSSIAHDDAPAVRNVLVAAETQFRTNPGSLIDNIFLPALRVLAAKNNLGWVRMPWFSWMDNPLLLALDENQAAVVLDALVPYPELEYDAEDIAAAIAARWPEKVIEFLEHRQTYADLGGVPEGYRDLPFDVHDLRAPLATAQEPLIGAARRWFARNKQMFQYGGGRLLTAVFPGLPDSFRDCLAGYVAGGNHDDLEFVLSILTNYEGRDIVHGLAKDIVAQIEADDPLMSRVRTVLRSTGVVSGEFGFVDLYAARKTTMQAWLADARERVRAFGQGHISELDRSITGEQRSAETSIALRKLDYDEELDDDAA